PSRDSGMTGTPASGGSLGGTGVDTAVPPPEAPGLRAPGAEAPDAGAPDAPPSFPSAGGTAASLFSGSAPRRTGLGTATRGRSIRRSPWAGQRGRPLNSPSRKVLWARTPGKWGPDVPRGPVPGDLRGAGAPPRARTVASRGTMIEPARNLVLASALMTSAIS